MDNCIMVRCLSPFHYRFIFVDIKDYASIRLLAEANIRVSHVKELMKRGSPYRLIVCCVRRKDLNKFSEALVKLRNNILLRGYSDYDEYCKKLKEAETILSWRKSEDKKMRKVGEKYYLIYDHILGKEDDGRYFIYKDKQWVPDNECLIMDHLMGYDPGEPPDSPYGIGCTDIMNEIKEIPLEKAMELMREN